MLTDSMEMYESRLNELTKEHGEFTDYKHETLADWFRGLIKGKR